MSITAPISPLATNVSTRTASTTSAASDAGNYNAFLQLLVTELKNQDPTKPLDPAQTVTQLATFSSVEQAVQTNALLASLNDNSSLSQASSLIGRSVSSPDGTVSGVVKSVMIADGGMIAVLADGRKIALSSGVTIS